MRVFKKGQSSFIAVLYVAYLASLHNAGVRDRCHSKKDSLYYNVPKKACYIYNHIRNCRQKRNKEMLKNDHFQSLNSKFSIL